MNLEQLTELYWAEDKREKNGEACLLNYHQWELVYFLIKGKKELQ